MLNYAATNTNLKSSPYVLFLSVCTTGQSRGVFSAHAHNINGQLHGCYAVTEQLLGNETLADRQYNTDRVA